GELFWVSFATVLAAATVLVTIRLVLLYGADRFNVMDFRASKELPLWQLLLTLSIAGVVIVYALVASIKGISTEPQSHTRYGTMFWLSFAAASGAMVAAIVVWLSEAIRFLYADPLPETYAMGRSRAMSSVPDLCAPARLMPNIVHRNKRRHRI